MTSSARVASVRARQILDSRGRPAAGQSGLGAVWDAGADLAHNRQYCGRSRFKPRHLKPSIRSEGCGVTIME